MRTIITIAAVGLLTTLCGLASIIIGIFNPYSHLIFYVGRIYARGILGAANTSLEISGRENIDSGKSYIFIANHLSHFDILAMFAALPGTVRFFTKKELFRIPLFGWAIKSVGMIPIDRSDRSQSRISMNQAIETIRRGVSVVVFPEGTRSPDGRLQAFKKGGFVIAIKGQIPIVPVSISGSEHILRKHSMKVHPGKIRIIIHPPVETSGYTYESRRELLEKTRDTIAKGIAAAGR